jgi:predicted acetyltransferase
MHLVWPSESYLPGYISALERGWSPNNLRPEAGREELEKIASDPARFLEELVDREAKGPPFPMPDGTFVARLPGYRRWLWDDEFCGSIGLRWQRGTNALPPYCLGHIGYAVVPWKQGKGYATLALKELLLAAPAEGLSYVEITTNPSNFASQRVIRTNGGVLVEKFMKTEQYGGTEELRFRIVLK